MAQERKRMGLDGESQGFVVEGAGPRGIFGVFEDDGETGYLYLYEPGGREVFRHLHIYNRASEPSIGEGDVGVAWSEDGSKCVVIIRGQVRGILSP